MPRIRILCWLITMTLLTPMLFTPALRADDLTKRLEAAVAKHQTGAPDSKVELAIVEELTALGEKHDDSWRADFWSAYLLSQIVMSHSESRGENIARAQTLIERALRRAKNDPSAPTADLLALQNLVYVFRLGGIKDEAEKERVQALADEALERAYETDPHSPVVMVMAGTSVIRRGKQEEDWSAVIAGRALLDKAAAGFAQNESPLGSTTHFNAEWIKPWSEWVDRMYEGGFDAE